MKTTVLAFSAITLMTALAAAAPVAAQETVTAAAGLAQRHHDHRRTATFQPPAPQFGGEIKLDAKDSKPYWPPTVVPPKGAPNVLLIMTDDAGYGVSGTFGGVIPTPALDRIAKAGLRYTQFHSTALCSPTRAALITGRNHHSVGFGVITEQSTGFPGYDSIIGPENATIGEILKRERLRHVVVRQEAQHAELSVHAGGAVRPMAGRAWASSISTASWAARPTSGRRTCSATRRRSSPGSASPATT